MPRTIQRNAAAKHTETRLTSQGYRVHSALERAACPTISSKLLIFEIRSFYGQPSRNRAPFFLFLSLCLSSFFLSFQLVPRQRYFPRFQTRWNSRAGLGSRCLFCTYVSAFGRFVRKEYVRYVRNRILFSSDSFEILFDRLTNKLWNEQITFKADSV